MNLITSPYDILPAHEKFFQGLDSDRDYLERCKDADPIWLNSPAVLLPYQQRWLADDSKIKFCEKSRRVGLSWASAAGAALDAAVTPGGMDVYYIGYNKIMAETFIKDCAFWSKSFQLFASEVNELFIEDEDNDILAYRIRFASGFQILALSSKPENLRSRKGKIIIDEAAFHPDFEELIKAALAIPLIWGGKLEVISTHNGLGSGFNQMIEAIRRGEKDHSLHTIDFREAISEGLYQRICLINNEKWSVEKEFEWIATTYKEYGSAAKEELDVIPCSSSDILFDADAVDLCATGAWENPSRHRKYLAAIDPNFGGADFFATQMWDITEFMQHKTDFKHSLVAEYARNHVGTLLSIKHSVEMIKAYKPYIAAVESNSGGAIIVEKLCEILPSNRIDITLTTAPSKVVNTDRCSMQVTFSQVKYPPGWDGIKEMKLFGRLGRKALTGHDDRVTSWAAGHAHLETAMNETPKASRPLAGKGTIERIRF